MDSFARGGLVFDVRDSGPADGEPVVLLHGFPQDSSAFDRLSPVLHSAGLRTLAPDQRGYSPGARPPGRAAYATREVVDDVLALLDAAGLTSAHVVGHDWGGIAAWALAAWHPWRVRTLTALSVPHPAAMSQAVLHSDQALRSAYIGFFQLPAVPERVLLAGGGTVLRRMLRRGGLPDALVDEYVARMQQQGALTAALNWYRALPVGARTPIGTVRVPTLHVWGAGDAFLGRAATEATAEFVAAPYALEVLEDVNHWIPELAAERTGELVTAHVRTHSLIVGAAPYGDRVAPELTRADVLAARVRAHQLDRDAGTLADTAVLDLGVQDTGADAGRWALALRGVPDVDLAELALVWTLRGAPHLYRRADLPGVAAATAPFSDADAAKRIFDGAKPLRAAGIPVLTALDTVAAQMREVVTGPTVKGEMSRQLTDRLTEPYLRQCRPCNAVHVYEQTFRLGALRAGLELQPDTSPPVLQPLPGFAPATSVPGHLDVVRGYLRLHGPATPRQVADYLDAAVKDVQAHWPDDAVEVWVEGERRWLLADDLDRATAGPVRTTRLLGPFDPYLQTRDRALLLPDPARAKDVWRILGRPGGVLLDGEIAGTWRPRKTGRKLGVQVELWREVPLGELEEQAARLAAVRGAELAGVDVSG